MYKTLLHLSSNTKHLIHCSVLYSLIIYYVYRFTFAKSNGSDDDLDPFEEYGAALTYLLYICRVLIFLPLPQCLFNFFGLTFYNAFINTVELKGSPQLTPFICFRVVTRGDYPELVKKNLQRNLKTCLDIGLENFTFEVATDQTLHLPIQNRVREVLIPRSYQTKTGALFKVGLLDILFRNLESLNYFDNQCMPHLTHP